MHNTALLAPPGSSASSSSAPPSMTSSSSSTTNVLHQPTSASAMAGTPPPPSSSSSATTATSLGELRAASVSPVRTYQVRVLISSVCCIDDVCRRRLIAFVLFRTSIVGNSVPLTIGSKTRAQSIWNTLWWKFGSVFSKTRAIDAGSACDRVLPRESRRTTALSHWR
jgi:hypothetical protein